MSGRCCACSPSTGSSAPAGGGRLRRGGRPAGRSVCRRSASRAGARRAPPPAQTERQRAGVRAGYAGAADPDLWTVIDGTGTFVSGRLADRITACPGSRLQVLAGDRPSPSASSPSCPRRRRRHQHVFVDIATAQELFEKLGRLDRIDLVADPARLAAVTAAVERVIPPGTRAIEPRVRTGEIGRMLRSFQLNLAALSYVALLVGMYLIYNTVAISVVQRVRRLGRCVRWVRPARRYFRTFLAEGALFGVAGSLAGAGAGRGCWRSFPSAPFRGRSTRCMSPATPTMSSSRRWCCSKPSRSESCSRCSRPSCRRSKRPRRRPRWPCVRPATARHTGLRRAARALAAVLLLVLACACT